MRQRVKLAQAIAHEPEVLLLDEPVTGMDPVNRRRVIDLVRRLGREGRTVLVSSHILHEVEAMTRRVLLVNHGRILAEGDVREIRELMDEHPHTVALRARDPRRLAAAIVGWPNVVSLAVRRRGRVADGADGAARRVLPRAARRRARGRGRRDVLARREPRVRLPLPHRAQRADARGRVVSAALAAAPAAAPALRPRPVAPAAVPARRPRGVRRSRSRACCGRGARSMMGAARRHAGRVRALLPAGARRHAGACSRSRRGDIYAVAGGRLLGAQRAAAGRRCSTPPRWSPTRWRAARSTYLVTRPVTRPAIFAGKFAAYLVTTLCLALPACVLTFFLLLSTRGRLGAWARRGARPAARPRGAGADARWPTAPSSRCSACC